MHPAFTRVASNQPEVMQYLDLVRDAASVFGLPVLPDNVVQWVNPITREDYVSADDKLQRNEVPSRQFENAKTKQLLRELRRETERRSRNQGTVIGEISDVEDDDQSASGQGEGRFALEDDGDSGLGWSGERDEFRETATEGRLHRNEALDYDETSEEDDHTSEGAEFEREIWSA